VKKLYVGNLSWDSTENDVREFFSAFGDVHSVAVILDRDTGRSRGFAFVEMEDEAADKAMREGDGGDLQGRRLRVNEAQERPRRDSGGGGGGGGGRRW